MLDQLSQGASFISGLAEAWNNVRWFWVITGVGVITGAWGAAAKIMATMGVKSPRFQIIVGNCLRICIWLGIFMILYQFRETFVYFIERIIGFL